MINEWKEILVDCMDQHLAKIIISGPRKKDSVRKIEIRPVLLKEQLVFQTVLKARLNCFPTINMIQKWAMMVFLTMMSCW